MKQISKDNPPIHPVICILPPFATAIINDRAEVVNASDEKSGLDRRDRSITQTQEAKTLDYLIVGGIPTVRLNRIELAEQMVSDCMLARQGILRRPKVVVSSNGSFIAEYHRKPLLRSISSRVNIVDADGMSLVFATKILCKRPLPERVATTDFIHDASQAAEMEGLRFYFLGARPGVAEKAAMNIKKRYPNLQICGVRHGYFNTCEIPEICTEIRALGTDVLWLGLGTPHQEEFATTHADRLSGLGWIRTCGGLFDHYSGEIPRAPIWMQNAGLEWLFRAMLEPKRLGKRYLKTNLSAVFHLMTKTQDAAQFNRNGKCQCNQDV